jgi:uncharacterized protein YgbK (DUF1537 family)
VSPMQLAIVADDLSGAAECAAHALLRVSRSSVVLHGRPDPRDQIVTLDTDTRARGGDEASVRLRAAADLVRSAPVVVKKVDSLLRGNLAREIAALAGELGRMPVVAVANPALRRTVRGGILHIDGTPLHATELWGVEASDPPPSVVDALTPLPAVVIPQSVVAQGVEAVATALSGAARAGAVAVCDSLTEHDLSTIHAATLALTHETLLVGSGALVDVAVRALALEPCPPPERRSGLPSERGVGTEPGLASEPGLPPQSASHGAPPTPRVTSLLMVLGTRAPSTSAQLARVSERADHVEVIAPTDLLTDVAGVTARLSTAVSTIREARLVVLTIDPAAVVDATTSVRVVAALAEVAAAVVDRFGGVFLSGGETARAVLDRLGVRTLRVVAELDTGTVVSHRDGGAVVITRPGSFGGPDSLLHVAERLLDSHATPRGTPRSTETDSTAQAPQHVTPKENR